jgi:outer membrane protein OmpA-like peptidoglycan-associated protein
MVVTKICPKCQKKYSDVSLSFCLEDGTRLVENKTGNAPPPTVLFSNSESVEPFNSQPENITQSNSSSLMMLGAGAILFALVAGVLGFVFLRGKSSPQANQPPANDVTMDYKKPDNSANNTNSTNFTSEPKTSADGCLLSDADKLSIKEINFAATSYKVTPESETILKNLAPRLKQLPGNCFVEISVHTDNTGDENLNIKLTTARAEAIEKYLVDLGVSAEKLKAFGYGGSNPIAPNSSDENRRMNRRVEFRLFTEDKSSENGAGILDLKDQNNLEKLKSEGVIFVSRNLSGSSKPNPLVLIVSMSADGELTLNSEKMGSVSGENNLSEKLRDIFKMREEMQIYREGTNTVEKTVTLKTPSRISREIFDRALKIIRNGNADPINLYVEN